MKTGDTVRINGTRATGTVTEPKAAIDGYALVNLPSINKTRMFPVSMLKVVRGSRTKGGAM